MVTDLQLLSEQKYLIDELKQELTFQIRIFKKIKDRAATERAKSLLRRVQDIETEADEIRRRILGS